MTPTSDILAHVYNRLTYMSGLNTQAHLKHTRHFYQFVNQQANGIYYFKIILSTQIVATILHVSSTMHFRNALSQKKIMSWIEDCIDCSTPHIQSKLQFIRFAATFQVIIDYLRICTCLPSSGHDDAETQDSDGFQWYEFCAATQ